MFTNNGGFNIFVRIGNSLAKVYMYVRINAYDRICVFLYNHIISWIKKATIDIRSSYWGYVCMYVYIHNVISNISTKDE